MRDKSTLPNKETAKEAGILSSAVIEVQTNIFVHFDEVLFSGDAEEAWWAVLIDVLRSQAEDRVGREPAASNALGTVFVGVGLCTI